MKTQLAYSRVHQLMYSQVRKLYGTAFRTLGSLLLHWYSALFYFCEREEIEAAQHLKRGLAMLIRMQQQLTQRESEGAD